MPFEWSASRQRVWVGGAFLRRAYWFPHRGGRSPAARGGSASAPHGHHLLVVGLSPVGGVSGTRPRWPDRGRRRPPPRRVGSLPVPGAMATNVPVGHVGHAHGADAAHDDSQPGGGQLAPGLEQNQVVEAAGGVGVIGPERPLPDGQGARSKDGPGGDQLAAGPGAGPAAALSGHAGPSDHGDPRAPPRSESR